MTNKTITIRTLEPYEKRAIEQFGNYTSLRWELVRFDDESPAQVIGIIDDPQADIVLTFAPWPDSSDDAAIALYETLEHTHADTMWIEGGFASFEYEDLNNEELTEDA